MKRASIRTALALALVFLSWGLWLDPLAAQTFPSRPLLLVVTGGAGATDVLARIVADGAKQSLGSIVVENRPGGNATIAGGLVSRAASDGHTLLMSGNPNVLGEAMNVPRPYRFFEDFEQVIHLVDLPFLLTVNSESMPVNSLREFIDFVKARPGKLVYISPGYQAIHFLGMEFLKLEAGLDILHVPYKSIGQGVTDMLAGRVQMVLSGYPAVGPHMKTGKFRILATIGARRSLQLPDVPTFAEAGVPGVELASWFGLAVPAKTPKAVIARLNTALNAVLRQPPVREKLAAQGLDPVGGSPEEITRRIRSDYERYLRIVKATGLKPE